MKQTFGFRKSARHALPKKQGTRKFDNREAALWVAPLVAVGTIAFLLFTALRPSAANTLLHFNKPHNPYVTAVTPSGNHADVMLATSPAPTIPSAPTSTGSAAPAPTPADSGASTSEPIAPLARPPVITTPSLPTPPTTPPALRSTAPAPTPTSPTPPPTSPAPPPTSPAPPPTSPAPPPTGGSPAPTNQNPTSTAPRMPAPAAGLTTASPTP